ncbi:RNA-binding domain-containing protein [Butyrivibrio sp. XPD2002]|uniref:RNA-binding domain-containing protein n=1 Tax=Butyrivibrio sp. XPD2002 TaxID=1280665 RepID=UPI000426387A|nr:RNA-binding domain-containing protein [Butyrivibrio sp. XPD2002]
MDYRQIKKRANEILKTRTAECSYVEYKASEQQLDKILKTICAYGNNYYNNDIQYLFIGVEEENSEDNKAIPVIPIKGIPEGRMEKCKNVINSLRSFLYPNVAFEVISNKLDGLNYLLIIVMRQAGGPFMVAEKAEKDKKINLKPGRYVRIEADTRLARVDEEYDLLRKFSNFHYSSIVSTGATIDDLDIDLLREYISKTSERQISEDLDKRELAKVLALVDKNDPSEMRVKNFAVLMFSSHPEKIVPYAYTECIIDMFGTKRKMESKVFKGAVWKQYYTALDYINSNFLNELVIRVDGSADNKRIENFTFIALEELLANAIVHNNYENGKPIQIYVSEKQINIVNYNKPLPPIRISDLNERTFFNERDTENPELRDMFKSLGIIESFGTGIGEAKRSMRENGSPDLYYKTFDVNDNITSVVIPVNEEYYEIKNGSKPKKNVWIESETKDFKQKILDSGFSKNIKQNMLKLYEQIGTGVFGNSRVVEILGCSEVTATSYLKRMGNELKIIVPVEGVGKGKYKFKYNVIDTVSGGGF